jgi:hypothetical protein
VYIWARAARQGRREVETEGVEGGYTVVSHNTVYFQDGFLSQTDSLFLLISTSLLNKNRGKEGGQTGKHNRVLVCVNVCVCVCVDGEHTHPP